MKRRIISIVSVILVVAMLSVVLVACAPKTMDDAKAKLADKGYTVIPTPVVAGVGALVATNKDDAALTVSAIYVEDKDKLDEQYKKFDEKYKQAKKDIDDELKAQKKKLNEDKNLSDADKKELKEDIKTLEDQSKNYIIKKSGNWVAFGHKKAVGALI